MDKSPKYTATHNPAVKKEVLLARLDSTLSGGYGTRYHPCGAPVLIACSLDHLVFFHQTYTPKYTQQFSTTLFLSLLSDTRS